MAPHPPGKMHPPGKEPFDEAQFAARLDHLIGGLQPRKASPQLKARILAAAGVVRGPGALLAALWPFGPLWRPATVLASAAVLGLALGLAVPGRVFPPSAAEASLAEEVVALAFVSDSALEEVE